MSACEPSLKPTGPSNRESLLSHFLLPVATRAKRSLRQTISIYRQIMNCPPEVPFSRAVHHLRTPRKPTKEKAHLASPAGPSVLQGVGCGENQSGTNDLRHQLPNMCLTGQGASLRQCHPTTLHTGPPPCHK